MAETLNLYQKLAKIRKPVEVMQRNKSGFGYKYVTDTELLAKISGLMDKYGVSLIPRIVPNSTSVLPYSYEKTKAGKTEIVNEILVHGDMQYIWVNNDNPEEKIVVDWAMVGHQGDGSQGFGSALTYSMRYFLLKYFGVATPEDDPDSWRAKQRAAEKEEEIAVAKGIIETVHGIVTEFLAKNPDKQTEVKKLVVKYVKGGDYFKINEPVLAKKLLDDINNTFINIKEE